MDDRFSKLHALHAVFGLDCPYTDTERLVAAALILDRGAEGFAFRSQEGMALRTGMSRRAVQRGLETLTARADGPLVVRTIAQGFKDGAGGRAPNRYSVELRASLTHKGAEVTRQPDAQPSGDLCAKMEGVVRQNEGGLCASLTQDRSRDRKKPSASTSDAAFSLAVPVVKQAARRTAKAKAKGKAVDPEHGAKHAKVVEFYFEAFERKRGSKPVGFDGADGRAVSKLLDKCKGDVAEACKVIAGAFASWKGDTVTIRQIASNPSEFIGSPKRANGRGTPVQPSYGVALDAEVIEA